MCVKYGISIHSVSVPVHLLHYGVYGIFCLDNHAALAASSVVAVGMGRTSITSGSQSLVASLSNTGATTGGMASARSRASSAIEGVKQSGSSSRALAALSCACSEPHSSPHDTQ